jgi:hypothetical protein
MSARNIWLLCLSVAYILMLAAAAPIPHKYQVKGAPLYNLAKFVESPAAALPEISPDMRLCMWREDLFGTDLEPTIAGKRVNGQDLVIKRFRAVQELAGYHIAFISASAIRYLPKIFEALRDSLMLTSEATEQVVPLGGMINLILEDKQGAI